MEPVVVVGGTGGTGRYVVERLLARGAQVRVAARDPAKARALYQGRVEVERFDLADAESDAQRAVAGAAILVVTAGVAPGFRSEATLRATEVYGLTRLLEGAARARFRGRLLYMTTLGLYHPTWALRLLDRNKQNTIALRREAEEHLAAAGFETTIVRAGILTNGRGGVAPLKLLARDAPLGVGMRVTRDDVARVIAALVEGPYVAEIGVVAGSPEDTPELVDLRARLVSPA